MLYFSQWKVIAIFASVVAGILLALPNVLPPAAQHYLAQHTIARPMTLGLDLQGGSYVLLEIDRNDLVSKLMEQLPGDIRGALRQARIAYKGIKRTREAGLASESVMGMCTFAAAFGFLITCIFGSFLNNEWSYWIVALMMRYAEIYAPQQRSVEAVPRPAPFEAAQRRSASAALWPSRV